MAQAGPGSSPTPTAADPAPPVDAMKHQNYERVEQGLHIILQALTTFAKGFVQAYHTSLLTKETTAADGTSRTTLCELPACTRHTRTPEDDCDIPNIKELLACPSCKPWIEALGAAHSSDPKQLNKKNLYPGTWRDPARGPWLIAASFVRGSCATTLEEADISRLFNIIGFFRGAFPTVTAAHNELLFKVKSIRDRLAHLRAKEQKTKLFAKGLSDDDATAHINTCIAALQSGPWSEGTFLASAQAAMKRLEELRDRPIKAMLPQLEELKPHYVPQTATMTWLASKLMAPPSSSSAAPPQRVAALRGLGGVGKSSAARAFAWQEARKGTFPGSDGVLWGGAGGAGGVAVALADVARRQLGLQVAAGAGDVVVRQKLREWSAQRAQPWLLVLDNVEPGSNEAGLRSLLGAHGVALITTRAGPDSLYHDMGLAAEAVHRVACLGDDEAYAVMMARYRGTAVGAASVPAPLAAPEEAAARELAGRTGLGGLPLALEQAAAMVASSPSQTFQTYLASYRKLWKVPEVVDERNSLPRVLADGLRSAGLHGVPGLLDQVLAMCESLDDVRRVKVEDLEWGSSGQQATVVQQRKWAEFQGYCQTRRAEMEQHHTVATVWATQLAMLPKYCVELLQGAACLAPDHIPEALLTRALVRWVKTLQAGSRARGWVKAFAESSELVKEVTKRLGGGAGLSTSEDSVKEVAQEVVEEALKWLQDVSLVHRGVWMSSGDVHPLLGAGVLHEVATAAGSGGATGGAGAGAGAGGDNSSTRSTQRPRPWFSMHRLVQGVVRAEADGRAIAVGLHLIGSMESELEAGVETLDGVLHRGVSSVACNGDAVEAMELAAWMAVHGHAVESGRLLLQAGNVESGVTDSAEVAVQWIVYYLSRLISRLGLYSGGDAWLQVLRQGVDVLKVVRGGGGSSDVAWSLTNLGNIYLGQSLYGEAEAVLVEALEMRQRMGEGDSSGMAWVVDLLGTLYWTLGSYDEAEPLLVQALAMMQRLHGDSDSSDVAAALNNLALLYQTQSRYADAEPLVEQALAMYQRLAGDSDSSDVAASLSNLAGVYYAQTRFAEAEAMYVQSLEMEQRLHGGSDSSHVARGLNNLAGLYAAQSRYAEAEALYARALAMYQRLHGGIDSSAVATSLGGLALLRQAQHRYDKAEPLFVKALAMEQRLAGGSDSSAVARSLNNLAVLYVNQCRFGEAEQLHVQALAMYRRLAGGNDSSGVARALNNLASLYEAQGQPARAAPVHTQAAEMRQRLAFASSSALSWCAIMRCGVGMHLALGALGALCAGVGVWAIAVGVWAIVVGALRRKLHPCGASRSWRSRLRRVLALLLKSCW